MSSPRPINASYAQLLEDNRADLNSYFLSRLQISRESVARVRLSKGGDSLIITKNGEGVPLTVDSDGAVTFSQKQRDALTIKPHDFLRLELSEERQELHVKKKEPGCITCHQTDPEFRRPNLLQCDFCETVSFYISEPAGVSKDTKESHTIDAMCRITLPQPHLDHFNYTPGCAVHLTLTSDGAAIIITRADEGLIIDSAGAVPIPLECLQSMGMAPGDSLEVGCAENFIMLCRHETEEEYQAALGKLDRCAKTLYVKLDDDGFLDLPMTFCYALDLRYASTAVHQALSADGRSVVIKKSRSRKYPVSKSGEIFFAYPRELGIAPGDYLCLYCDQDAKTITITKKEPGCTHCHAVDVSFTKNDLWCDNCWALFKSLMKQQVELHDRAKTESDKRKTAWAESEDKEEPIK